MHAKENAEKEIWAENRGGFTCFEPHPWHFIQLARGSMLQERTGEPAAE